MWCLNAAGGFENLRPSLCGGKPGAGKVGEVSSPAAVGEYTVNLAGFLCYTFVTKQHCEGMTVTP